MFAELGLLDSFPFNRLSKRLCSVTIEFLTNDYLGQHFSHSFSVVTIGENETFLCNQLWHQFGVDGLHGDILLKRFKRIYRRI